MTTDADVEALLRGHRARNSSLLHDLTRRGVDLNVLRPVEHHFWSESHRSGVDLATELYRRGFVITVLARTKTEDPTRDLWNIEAEIQQSVTAAASEETAQTLVQMAARLECIYDGWGTRI